MDLKQLRYFKTIVDEGNISKAAEVLHIAQPPLSQQLKRMEDELGTTLINRHSRKLQLTESGRALYNHATDLLQRMGEFDLEIQEIKQGMRGTLTIGVSSSCVSHALKRVKEIVEKTPNIYIKMLEGDSYYLEELLLKRDIEIAIMLSPLQLQAYELIKLPEERFVLVVPEFWYPKFNTAKVNLKEITNYPFIILGQMKGYSIYENIINSFYKKNLYLNIILECRAISTLLALVSSGVGVSIVPQSELSYMGNNGFKVIEIEESFPTIEPVVLWLKNHYLSKAAQHFLNNFAT